MSGACRMAQSRMSQRRPYHSQYRQPTSGFRLAPVLEHYEAPERAEEEEEELAMAVGNRDDGERPAAAAALSRPPGQCNFSAKKAGATRLRILSKLRDGYVKLLNDVACGSDFSGVASFYGCPAGGADQSAAFYARMQREARQKLQDRMQDLDSQRIIGTQETARRCLA